MNKRAPDVIQEAAVFIDGMNYLGVSKEVQLPKIEQLMVEANGALKGKVSSGVFEPLEVSLKLEELNQSTYLSLLALNSKAQVPISVRTSIHKASNADFALSADFKGEIASIEESAHSSGQAREVSIKINLNFYSLKQNKMPLIIYDRINYIFNVSGVDLLADLRSNLEL